jgi:hypothetical protein
MKKNLIFSACFALMTCSCACDSKPVKPVDQNVDQDYQERRKMQQTKPQGGCCEAEKGEMQQKATAASDLK